MSLDHVRDLLETLRCYNKIDITHTFEKDEKSIASVCCIKNTSTLQVTMFETQSTKQYENVEKAASVIEKLINE